MCIYGNMVFMHNNGRRISTGIKITNKFYHLLSLFFDIFFVVIFEAPSKMIDYTSYKQWLIGNK